jgi:hypothetical protein
MDEAGTVDLAGMKLGLLSGKIGGEAGILPYGMDADPAQGEYSSGFTGSPAGIPRAFGVGYR